MSDYKANQRCILNITAFDENMQAINGYLPSKRSICTELGKSVTTFDKLKDRNGRTGVPLVKALIDKYFPNNQRIYQQLIADEEGRKNYEREYGESDDKVPANFGKIEMCAEAMKLNMRSICRVLDYDEDYYSKCAEAGKIGLQFIVKFAELTNNKVAEFETRPPQPQPIEEIPSADYNERLDDIDATLVGILKVLQQINKKLDKAE